MIGEILQAESGTGKESIDLIVEPITEQSETKSYLGHADIPTTTVDAYLEILKAHLPAETKNLRTEKYEGGTTQVGNITIETFYMTIKQKKEPLTWDESRQMGIEVTSAEKRDTFVAGLNPQTGEFKPESHLSSLLYKEVSKEVYKKGSSEPDTYAILGVVGPKANYFGNRLYLDINSKIVK